METSIATNVSKCSTCLRMKDDYQKPSEQLNRVHSTFQVSNLKKYLSDETIDIPLDEIQVDEKLHFIKEPIEIMDGEVKRLKQSRIPIVKIGTSSSSRPETYYELYSAALGV
nr:putative reverse transcriptase domain-containing protein [Tanacetum cinerariifolium]